MAAFEPLAGYPVLGNSAARADIASEAGSLR